MKVYHLKRVQVLPVTIHEAWSFFSSPDNLHKITPEYMKFKILYISENSSGRAAYPGQIIRYNVNIFPNIAVHWTTEITHVKELSMFVDEQRNGPYKLWHHQHHFREVSNGVEMTDEIHYAMPFGIAGRMVHRLLVANQLKRIFDYRKETLAKLFN